MDGIATATNMLWLLHVPENMHPPVRQYAGRETLQYLQKKQQKVLTEPGDLP